MSSLAAAGPSSPDRLRTEEDATAPVSIYGRTKLAGELQAIERAAEVPTTIVRPPIVLGAGDRDGLVWFRGIATWGMHFVPTMANHRFSVIHVEDLVIALTLAAERSRRLSPSGEGGGGSRGIYFVAADETPTFAELGHMIGAAVGRSRVWMVRNPVAAVWTIATCNELLSHLRRRSHILSRDKAREAIAGSWSCSDAAFRRDVGFQPERPLAARLRQTAEWYFDQGWLRRPRGTATGDQTTASG